MDYAYNVQELKDIYDVLIARDKYRNFNVSKTYAVSTACQYIVPY